ncbi:Protein of unknown function [Gryllus bimaculatus]|nr:Protein of unknown function [Gryllus bimaculatus]
MKIYVFNIKREKWVQLHLHDLPTTNQIRSPMKNNLNLGK